MNFLFISLHYLQYLSSINMHYLSSINMQFNRAILTLATISF